MVFQVIEYFVPTDAMLVALLEVKDALPSSVQPERPWCNGERVGLWSKLALPV